MIYDWFRRHCDSSVAAETRKPRGKIVLTGLAPLVGPHTKIVILGSFPGVASLRAQAYYGHPRNQFWRLLATSLAETPERVVAAPYPERVRWMLEVGVGVWDVYAACEREGSLDTAIRAAELNPLGELRVMCPGLTLIAHNGGESFRHARHTRELGLPVLRLPSSSPANAGMTFETKLSEWRQALASAGLEVRPAL